jgi:mono/diheme cytochrome c family protein
MPDRRIKNKILFLLVWIPAVLLAAADLGGGLAAQAPANATTDKQAQIEKGRQAVGQTCAACHAPILRMAQAQKQNEEQWKDTIYSMIGRGAEILPDEIEPMAAFLAATSARGGTADAQPAGGGGGRGGRGGAGAGGTELTDGRAILQRTCQQCHDMATATAKPASEDWTAVLAKMAGYGAKLSPAEQQKLIEYLNGLTK